MYVSSNELLTCPPSFNGSVLLKQTMFRVQAPSSVTRAPGGHPSPGRTSPASFFLFIFLFFLHWSCRLCRPIYARSPCQINCQKNFQQCCRRPPGAPSSSTWDLGRHPPVSPGVAPSCFCFVIFDLSPPSILSEMSTWFRPPPPYPESSWGTARLVQDVHYEIHS